MSRRYSWSVCCPAESKRGTQGAGYATLARLLEGFAKIDCLPKKINLARFDDGEGVEATMRKHRAKWHDTCRQIRLSYVAQKKRTQEDRPVESDSD